MKHKRAQAAFEYLTTYGWAILTAIIVTGALAYFGFLNPGNLLPNKCDFGKQLECTEYKIQQDGAVGLWFRNNFGKDITITDVQGIELASLSNLNSPVDIPSGAAREVTMTLDPSNRIASGEKQEINLMIVFQRKNVASPTQHNLTGTVFVTVQ